MKNRKPSGKGIDDGVWTDSPKPMNMKKKKNINRLGGTGLSLQAFATAKSTTNHYNPALIKKKRELYKNAKLVKKYKKSLKQQNNRGNDPSSSTGPQKDENENVDDSSWKNKKYKKTTSSHGLKEVYERQREEKEKERMERETIIQAKKEQKEKAEAQRKEGRKKMFKRTRHGQPVMKYRIQNLLESIQSSYNSTLSGKQ